MLLIMTILRLVAVPKIKCIQTGVICGISVGVGCRIDCVCSFFHEKYLFAVCGINHMLKAMFFFTVGKCSSV